MSIDRPTLEEFVRHAERFGSELVYETALEYLSDARDRAGLSLALQRIDRRWRLEPRERARLALALDQAGLADAEVCAAAQLSRTTLHRLRQKQAEQEPAVLESRLDSAQPCGGNAPKPASPSTDTTRAEVKHVGR